MHCSPGTSVVHASVYRVHTRNLPASLACMLLTAHLSLRPACASTASSIPFSSAAIWFLYYAIVLVMILSLKFENLARACTHTCFATPSHTPRKHGHQDWHQRLWAHRPHGGWSVSLSSSIHSVPPAARPLSLSAKHQKFGMCARWRGRTRRSKLSANLICRPLCRSPPAPFPYTKGDAYSAHVD
jgi:hypothetical protein